MLLDEGLERRQRQHPGQALDEQTIGQHQQQRLRHFAQAEGLTDMPIKQGKGGPRGAGAVETQQVTQRAQMLRDRLDRAVGLKG